MNENLQPPPSDGVSRSFKIGVIVFGVFIFLGGITVFGVVAARMVSHRPPPWESRLPELAEKLVAAGLKDKAIEQYKIYLERAKVDGPARARISLAIADLYQGAGDCREALVWLYQAELADPESARQYHLAAKIGLCLEKVR